MRFSQEFEVVPGHKVEFILDIENLGNLINNSWGRLDTIFEPSNIPLANMTINGANQFDLSAPTTPVATAQNPNIARLPSVYRIQVGLRYRF